MVDYHLFNKTELQIERLSLHNANLTEVAAVVADTLHLDRDRVLVVDVREDTLTLDVLQDKIDPANVVGRQEELLERLASVPGLEVRAETSITSDGMLGWIALHEQAEALEALKRSEEMAGEVRQKLSRRAIVFSTGTEVLKGQIEDTNTPTIVERLEAVGYSVTRGPTLGDDVTLIAGKLREAIFSDGSALVITTGGVGAEDKDCTVEAVLELDPTAATPYIAKHQKGTGRHQKDGVKIAVGQVEDAIVVALPGPNDEVRASLEVLVQGLRGNRSKGDLAEAIAENLRGKLREKTKHWDHGGSES